MPRFTVTPAGRRIEIAFDDGGVNLLSAAALRELRSVLRDGFASACHPERSEGSGRKGGAEIDLYRTTQPPRSLADARDDKVLVFRSSHAHIFAAGADMAEMRDFTPLEAAEFARLGQETFDEIERLPIATVALIDGDCFGGALDLVMSFDLRFATPRSRFSHPGAKLGIVTGFGGTSRWRKVLDRTAARKLFLGNPILSANEAKAIGLVDVVGEDFGPELARLESLDPQTLRFVKELTNHADRLSRSELSLLAERLAHIYFPT